MICLLPHSIQHFHLFLPISSYFLFIWSLLFSSSLLCHIKVVRRMREKCFFPRFSPERRKMVGFNRYDDLISWSSHFGSTLMHSNANESNAVNQNLFNFLLRWYGIQVFRNKCHTNTNTNANNTWQFDNMCACVVYSLCVVGNEIAYEKSAMCRVLNRKLNWYRVASLDSGGFRLPKHTPTHQYCANVCVHGRVCGVAFGMHTNPRLTAFVISSNCQS